MSWGAKAPTSTTTLKALDVWKYGETTTKRYSDIELENIGSGGVTQVKLITSNQVQIKVAEKAFIYSYFLSKGYLPPGNKIFR